MAGGCSLPTALHAVERSEIKIGDTVLIVQEGWGASTTATGSPGAAIDSAIGTTLSGDGQ